MKNLNRKDDVNCGWLNNWDEYGMKIHARALGEAFCNQTCLVFVDGPICISLILKSHLHDTIYFVASRGTSSQAWFFIKASNSFFIVLLYSGYLCARLKLWM